MMNLKITETRLSEILSEHKYSRGAGRHRASFDPTLYYSININGKFINGGRPFEKRWDYLKKINLNNKRILDVGSNIGLLGIFYITESGASHVTMLEHDEACVKIINLLAEELNLSEKITVHQKNFNDLNLGKDLGYDFDTVNLLSSLKYFNDQDSALNYFGNFNQVIFEGDDEEYEKQLEEGFRSVGFNMDKIARVNEISGGSGRNRMLYNFTK